MIWGLKDDDPRKQAKNPFLYWQLWFAWYPVCLEDGRWAWLQYVEYRCVGYLDGCDNHYREAFQKPLKMEG